MQQISRYILCGARHQCLISQTITIVLDFDWKIRHYEPGALGSNCGQFWNNRASMAHLLIETEYTIWQLDGPERVMQKPLFSKQDHAFVATCKRGSLDFDNIQTQMKFIVTFTD
jgi:hypothetical protein